MIGLTVGAGKSSVARILQSLGAAVIESDRHVYEEFGDPEVAATLQGWWGEKVCHPDGTIDPQGVASVVFDAPAELARLECLVHPRLARRRERLVAEYMADSAFRAVVLDSPKLIEVGSNNLCDAVVFVDADRSIRLNRLASSRGWTDEELTRRENLLTPLDTKKAIADYVLRNHSSIADLRPEVERVLASVLEAFSRSR
ncbi:MAG: dephospho-CoA kinase [Phycisphaerales bacterium]|nr:MAG: dephospho-CoA kinase [Phycisphaerales bacterium]